jgi:hypothetical protein
MSTSPEFTQGEPGERELGSQEDWEIIEAALGFKDFDPQRRKALCRRLQITVKIYYPRLGRRRHELRPGHFRSALGVLRDHAARLRCYLDAAPGEPWPTDELDELEDLALGVFLCDHYLTVPKRNRRQLTNRLAELIGLIDNSLQSLAEDKGGLSPNEPLRLLIYELADLYWRRTGKRPGISRDNYKRQYCGPFLRLVSRVLKIFAPDQVKGDNALAGDIRRVAKWWRQVNIDKTMDPPERVPAIF